MAIPLLLASILTLHLHALLNSHQSIQNLHYPQPKEGTNEDGDVKQAEGIEDSNLANYGSQAHVDARKAAAESEKEFVGAGQKVGLEVWRVENKRTEADTPDFGVKRWTKEEYGSFYTGDSYLVLNTYLPKVRERV